MKWLRFGGSQYINTGIKPSAGYSIKTTIRAGYDTSTYCLFGSRNGGSANTSSFNAFHIFDPGVSPTWIYKEYWRLDYGGAGSDLFQTDLSVDRLAPKIYELVLGSTNSVNGVTEAGGAFASNAYDIFVGTLNAGGSPDSRYARCDFAEFTIFNASGVAVFDGVPVEKDSTEFSGTPAPSNCYWDKVSGSYKTNSGSNFIGFEDDDIPDTDSVVLTGEDYGIKILSNDEYAYEIMNGKYKLFGADLASDKSQFKTFEFTLTGFDTEPSISWPSYIENWEFYFGSGSRKKEQIVIDTGFDPKTIKSMFVVSASSFTNSNFVARAHQYLVGNGSYNQYITPSSSTAPAYVNIYNTRLSVHSDDTTEYPMILGQQGIANWNTLGSFNGGTIQQIYWDIPQLYFKLDSDGKLRISTSIPYNWIQRAGTGGYRVRWYDWCWFQGITLRLTILSTPYII